MTGKFILFFTNLTRSFPRTQARAERLNWRIGLAALLMAAAFAAFLAAVQFATPDMPDNDGYYHIKMAYLMRTEGLLPDFIWLPLTILNPDEFYDHHFLFHVGLIPFTFGDLRVGAKLAAVTFATLAFLMVWWLMRSQQIPYAAIWALGLLAVSEAFIYRMSITRAQSLSLGVLALGLHWIFNKRYWRVMVLGFFYVWLYNAFPLLPVVALAYAAGVWVVEGRLEWQPVFFAALGVALGMVINPYFPDNIIFAYRHMLPKLVDATSTSVGNEWYPYETGQLLENSPLSLVAFTAGALALGLSGRRMSSQTATAFFIAVLTGLMLFQSRRFIEYFPAFALIFAGFAWGPVLGPARVSSSELSTPPEEPAPGRRPRFWLPEQMRRSLAAGVLSLVVIAGIAFTLPDARNSLRGSKPYQMYAGASAWLEQNTPPRARVFQTDWDDFPRLFFYNHHNTYLIGLDPTYMQLYDPNLYDRWVAITRGQVDQPAQAIWEEFESEYVVSDLNHTAFIREAAQDSNLIEVYRDDFSVVYQVEH